MAYMFVFLFAILVTIIINKLLLVFALSLGTRGEEKIQVRWASTSKPSLGGFAYYLVFLGTLCCLGFLDLDFIIFTKKQFIGVLITVSLGFAIGFADDTYNTNPKLKAIGQLCCGILLYIFDIQIQLFNDYNFVNFLFTTFWVAALMNSINMLDNMDAVTASSSIMIILFFILILFNFILDFNILFILVGVLGTLIGFLYHNWHPAKLYMGDAGSQFLGIVLAIFSIPLLWNNVAFNGHYVTITKLIFTFLVFCIPIIDTLTVIFYRIKKGSSPFIGGADHTTHHLVYCGFTEKQVVLFFSSINVFGLIMAYIFIGNKLERNYILIGIILFIISVFIIIQNFYKKGLKNKQNNISSKISLSSDK